MKIASTKDCSFCKQPGCKQNQWGNHTWGSGDSTIFSPVKSYEKYRFPQGMNFRLKHLPKVKSLFLRLPMCQIRRLPRASDFPQKAAVSGAVLQKSRPAGTWLTLKPSDNVLLSSWMYINIGAEYCACTNPSSF